MSSPIKSSDILRILLMLFMLISLVVKKNKKNHYNILTKMKLNALV